MKTEMKIADNAKWYYANLDSLLPQYRGKYVAITGGSVFGSYDDCATGVLAIEKAGTSGERLSSTNAFLLRTSARNGHIGSDAFE